MSEAELPAAAPPPRPWFQFSLQTLFLLFVVLATSMGLFGPWGAVIFVLTVGLAACLNRFLSVQLLLGYLAFAAFCSMCVIGIHIAIRSVLDPGRNLSCMNHATQIALALHAYEAANGHLPPAYVADKDGKPLYSWRVLILPYLEETALYKRFNLDEPWDSPNNKKLLAERPRLFVCPSDETLNSRGNSQTGYVAVVGPNAAWLGNKPRTLSDFSAKGTANTVMVVEVANTGIEWTEPRDLPLDALQATGAGSPAIAPSSYHGEQSGFFYTYDARPNAIAAMADASVRFLWHVTADHLPRILEIGGCTEAEIDSLLRDDEPPPGHWNWPNIAAFAVWLLSVTALLTRAVRSRRTKTADADPRRE